ncbi:ph domain-containing [Fusarium albosuccineum]|uniref:Ph domain-containing n=1 Tax=Fusarium albosuccineum TaxID=1237068 RepID=A0A8H4LAQ4_9HYPO|nr:ph domain-containing [Fusarium albosuccineum]
MAGTLVEPPAPQLQASLNTTSLNTKLDITTRPRSHSNIEAAFSPVNNDGCFDFDRVVKSGHVQKRTQKTKVGAILFGSASPCPAATLKWKTVYLVLRPNTLSLYKTEKEDRLRHQIYLSELTAVAELKDPKHKRDNVFGLFSPSRNYHFQAPSSQDAHEWISLIRKDARIEQEEDEMFLASPRVTRQSLHGVNPVPINGSLDRLGENERFLSSSPEPLGTSAPKFGTSGGRRRSSILESSGLSGAEFASHSDLSDNEALRVHDASFDSFAVQSPANLPTPGAIRQPGMGIRPASQTSVSNIEQDPDRVIWQGWLYFLRNRRGMRQWKDMWAVLRPRNLILYKDESEYTARWILPLSSIVNVVDIDPLSKSKKHCLQVITEEKSYRFCAHDEDALVRCIGAFKSLLAKRRELEARVAGTS